MSPQNFFAAFSEQAIVWINLAAQGVDALPVPFAFSAGMLASVNPCGFIMLPAFAAFYITQDDAERGRGRFTQVLLALEMGAVITAAFILTFSVVGVLISAGARFITHWVGWAGLFIGIALITLGLAQLATRRSLLAGVTAGVRVRRSRSLHGAAAFGLAYAVASLGCTLPVFMLIASSVFVGSGRVLDSALRFVEYAAGMGAVLTAVTVGIALFRQQTTRVVSSTLPWVEGLGNLLLVFAGSYLIWYWTSRGGLI